MPKIWILLILVFVLVIQIQSDPLAELANQLNQILNDRQLRGIQLQLTRDGKQLFYHNVGTKNTNNDPIDSNTIFMVASLSKSFSSVAILQLIEKGFLNLNDTLTSIFGFDIKNPFYPDTPITLEMLLSHQSSLQETNPQYLDFMRAAQNNNDGGYSIPSIKEILSPGGKYYNQKFYSNNRKPGQYFSYSNLGYVIAGTIVEIVSKLRFDIYIQQNILDYISEGLTQKASFNPATIQDYHNLGWIFVGKDGKWVPNRDNFTSPIIQKNLTFYKVGTNAGVYGPAAQLRASVRHLNNYLYMISNKGVTKAGKRILSEASVNELLKPRYQFHGAKNFNQEEGMYLYGLGIYTTSYLGDSVIDHEVIHGHLGDNVGLISAEFFWKNYAFSYIINGALNGYETKNGSFYEVQRVLVHQAVNKFVYSIPSSHSFKIQPISNNYQVS